MDCAAMYAASLARWLSVAIAALTIQVVMELSMGPQGHGDAVIVFCM